MQEPTEKARVLIEIDGRSLLVSSDGDVVIKIVDYDVEDFDDDRDVLEANGSRFYISTPVRKWRADIEDFWQAIETAELERGYYHAQQHPFEAAQAVIMDAARKHDDRVAREGSKEC